MTAPAIYWPGTAIPKSRNNAFNWRGEPSSLADQDRAYYHPPRHDKALRGKKAFGDSSGGTIVGLSNKADCRLVDIVPKALEHVSRARRVV